MLDSGARYAKHDEPCDFWENHDRCQAVVKRPIAQQFFSSATAARDKLLFSRELRENQVPRASGVGGDSRGGFRPKVSVVKKWSRGNPDKNPVELRL